MTNVIVAFSKIEDARNIKNILIKHGIDVAAVATSGSQAISCAGELGAGILVCGSRFADMMYWEICECLPDGFFMLLLSSPNRVNGSQTPVDFICLSLPLRVHELMETLDMVMQTQARRRRKQKSLPRQRSFQEEEVIQKAKELLLDRNHMTETEAHRYIQKCSMDNGTNMVETAQMIMSLIHAG